MPVHPAPPPALPVRPAPPPALPVLPAPPPALPSLPPLADCIRNPNDYSLREIEAAMNQMQRVMQQHGARFDVNRHYDPESAAYRVAYEMAGSHVETRNAMIAQRAVYAYPG